LSQPTADEAVQLGDNKMSCPHALFQVRIVCGQPSCNAVQTPSLAELQNIVKLAKPNTAHTKPFHVCQNDDRSL